YREPILVSGTDGVGTKLRLAMDLAKHDSIGIDLVAMCVKNHSVQGAEPLFSLDYYATGKRNVDVAARVVNGIGEGCVQAGCALVGGETAEMPGMYHGEDYDLAGFCVGVVEKAEIIDGSKVKAGDTLLALASSGPHSNGYSLIRKVIEVSQADLQQSLGQNSLGQKSSLADALMAPTRIYVKPLLALMKQVPIHALSHITGGGLLENIPRVLPEHTQAVIDRQSWEMPPVFRWLQEQGNIAEQEMYRTFNCGVGMVICVAAEQAEQATAFLRSQGETVWTIGHIAPAEQAEPVVTLA